MGVEWLTHSGLVGRIQGEDQLKIIDERSEECKLGEVGEIFFKIGWRARLDLRRLDVGTFPNKLRGLSQRREHGQAFIEKLRKCDFFATRKSLIFCDTSPLR